MLRIIYWLIIPLSFSYSQNNYYHAPENIKLFADHLFCESDYLRAIEEYNRLDSSFISDTILFKIGFSYLQIGERKLSDRYFDTIDKNSSLKSLAVNYKSFNLFLNQDFESLKKNVQLNSDLDITGSQKLLLSSLIIYENKFPSNEQLSIFDNSDRLFINELVIKKKYPDHKSPTVAGILSIIPGLGKLYTKDYSDGLTSLLITGIFSFLGYENFNNSHQFRGYLFSLTALGFYLGNIYGSIISAKRYNQDYYEKVYSAANEYLKQKNYFIQQVKFCE